MIQQNPDDVQPGGNIDQMVEALMKKIEAQINFNMGPDTVSKAKHLINNLAALDHTIKTHENDTNPRKRALTNIYNKMLHDKKKEIWKAREVARHVIALNFELRRILNERNQHGTSAQVPPTRPDTTYPQEVQDALKYLDDQKDENGENELSVDKILQAINILPPNLREQRKAQVSPEQLEFIKLLLAEAVEAAKAAEDEVKAIEKMLKTNEAIIDEGNKASVEITRLLNVIGGQLEQLGASSTLASTLAPEPTPAPEPTSAPKRAEKRKSTAADLSDEVRVPPRAPGAAGSSSGGAKKK